MKRTMVLAGMAMVAMLAVMPMVSAIGGPFTWVGNVTYCSNGTLVPAGWHVCMENLNHTEFAGQPWHFMTDEHPFWNAHAGGEKEGDEDWIYVNVTDTDQGYVGEFTTKLGDIFDTGTGFYIRDFCVHEISVPFSKDLALGWNIVSLPQTPTDNSVSAVLASIAGKYDSVMKYTPATGFEEVTTMDTGVGYFIHMNEAGTWSYDDDSYESMSVSLSPGLNMVGWVNSDASLPDALDSIAGSYRYVARWNTAEQKYEVYDPIAPDGFNDFDTMEGGVGYFIAATAECTLGYP